MRTFMMVLDESVKVAHPILGKVSRTQVRGLIAYHRNQATHWAEKDPVIATAHQSYMRHLKEFQDTMMAVAPVAP